MSDDFPTVDVAQAQADLFALHHEVARTKRRVEISGPDGDGDCVLISKEELIGLEQAVEILSDDPRIEAIRQSLGQLMAEAAQP